MTITAQELADLNAQLAARNQTLRTSTQDGVNVYTLCDRKPIKKIENTDLVAFGALFGITIASP
jgi:hypothetical protein